MQSKAFMGQGAAVRRARGRNLNPRARALPGSALCAFTEVHSTHIVRRPLSQPALTSCICTPILHGICYADGQSSSPPGRCQRRDSLSTGGSYVF